MSTFNVTQIRNKTTDGTDFPNRKTEKGPFDVHYKTPSVSDGSLAYGQSNTNLGNMDSLEIWGKRGNEDRKCTVELIPNDPNFNLSLTGQKFTLTYTPSSIPGVSRPQDPKNVQVVVGAGDQ